MKIRLDENYYIEDDATCWALVCTKPTIDPKTGLRRVSEKTGEPTFGTKLWYHSKLQYAMLQYVDEGLKGASSCQEVLERLKTLETNVINACGSVK